MELEQKHYYAFISHNIADEKTAKWLCKQLERYHIPTTIQKDYNAPKHLRPLFLFQTDLAGNNMNDALSKELNDSLYLIVICSPSAAKSPYVNKGVQYFIDMGLQDKIIPFIVEGKPFASLNGDIEHECFPPAMVALKGTDKELRGINLEEETKERGSKQAAVVDVIASMLGIRFSILWNRHRKRKVKQYIYIGLCSLMLILLCAFSYLRLRPSVIYYSSCALRNGILTGQHIVPQNDVKDRSGTYAFFYKRKSIMDSQKTLYKIAFVNSVGTPAAFPHNVMQYQAEGLLDGISILYPRFERGNLKSIMLCDDKNRQLAEYVYTFKHFESNKIYAADITYFDDHHSDWESLSGMPTPQSAVRRIIYTTDDNGYVKKLTYHSHNGASHKSIMQDISGVCGFLLDYDDEHRIIKQSSIDEHEQLCNNKQGLCTLQKKYIGDTIVVYSYFDQYNKKTMCAAGFASVQLILDEDDDIKKITYFDTLGNISMCFQGWAQQKFFKDKKNRVSTTTYYNLDNRPTITIGGFCSIREKRDKQGNVIEISYMDTNGKLVKEKESGCAKVKYRYDRKNNWIEKSFYDKYGKLMIAKDTKSAIVRRKFDKDNRCVECTYYDERGNKTLNVDGWCKAKLYFDDDYLIEIQYYDENDNIVNTKREGCAIIKNATYFDKDNFKILQRSFYDNDHQPIFSKLLQCYKSSMKLNETSSILEYSRLDAYGKPMIGEGGWATIIFGYDEIGRLNKMEYLDENGDLRNVDVSIDSLVYLSNNHYFEYSLNTKRQPYYHSSGCAIIESKQIGDTIIRKCYDADTMLINCINNYAICKEVRRKDGKIMSISYYDDMENPCLTYEGFHKIVNEYNTFGDTIQSSAYDSNLNIVMVKKMEYDNRGNCIAIALFDSSMRPICIPNTNIHLIRRFFNDRDMKIEETTYDIDSNLCACVPYEYAVIKHEYDKMDNIIETTCYDENLTPTHNPHGVFMEKMKYNNRNLLIETTCYDSSNNRVNNNAMFCMIKYMYNKYSQITEDETLDKDSVLLFRRKTYYTSEGYPKTREYFSGGMQSVITRPTPCIYADNRNKAYVILNWEGWNITDGLNARINYLMKTRCLLDKQMVVMDVEHNIIDTIFDSQTLLELSDVPQIVYDSICYTYIEQRIKCVK